MSGLAEFYERNKIRLKQKCNHLPTTNLSDNNKQLGGSFYRVLDDIIDCKYLARHFYSADVWWTESSGECNFWQIFGERKFSSESGEWLRLKGLAGRSTALAQLLAPPCLALRIGI